MTDRATEVALFRYALIREAADPALSTRWRGRLVRRLAEGVHVGRAASRVRVGRSTADQWTRAWRLGGFEALLVAVVAQCYLEGVSTRRVEDVAPGAGHRAVVESRK